MFSLILKQTITHAFRKGGGAMGTAAFYIIIVTLFTFALSPETMAHYAGAVMAAAMLLSSLIALPLFYERDFEDGTLEQYLVQPVMLELLVLAKIAGGWLAIALPILMVSPLLAMFSGLAFEQAQSALLSLLLASPSIVAVGSLAAALTIGVKRGGLLQALIILPLYMPILIFAASAGGQGATLFLTAILLASLPLSCFVSAWLIRAAE